MLDPGEPVTGLKIMTIQDCPAQKEGSTLLL